MTNTIDTDREAAWNLLCEYTKSENLLKHALAVEAVMRAYADKYEGDLEKWGVAGLVHDFDWEVHPTLDEHPQKGAAILRKRGYSDEVINAVLGHAEHTGVPRETDMAKALFASDELTGLITAVALVRPSKNIGDVKLKSIKKKWKEKAFAAGANREEITRGAEDMGIPLEEHIGFVLAAMQGVAAELGLAGE
jgi:putative nucleotidyltransferase with HDIG domain